MPITAFTGPPGSGKSHALVKDVILPAVLAGRRVLTNVDGINPDAIYGYCAQRVDDVAKLGRVEVFHGDDALKPGFFPDESTAHTDTVVKGGDLLVFDEWALTFPRRGKDPAGCNVEPFLRWHRHLNGPNGQATDVCIGTQVPADINLNYRPLVARSYRFKKLDALGAEGTYAWTLYQGHLQNKTTTFKNGTGFYDPEVFPFYKSSAAAEEGTHVELRTNRNDTIWSGWKAKGFIASFVLGIPLLLAAGYWSFSSFGGEAPAEVSAPVNQPAIPSGPTVAAGQPVEPNSPWRIVGTVQGEYGTRVVVADAKGGVRMLKPDSFDFDEGRPIAGRVDGRLAIAEDRLPSSDPTAPIFGGVLQ